MARTIDADVLANKIMEIWDRAENEGRTDIANFIANIIVPCIVGTPTIEPKQEWISVKDRLPEVEKRVLVLAWAGWDTDKKYPKIVCGMYEDGTIWSEDSDWNWETDCLCEYDEDQDDWKIPEGWFEYCLYNEDNLNYAIDNFVTHWMPLPEPPKEGDLDE